MHLQIRALILLGALPLLVQLSSSGQYTPDWKSLDTRPLPTWYDDAKVGIFIHWGVFSVPSYRSEWFWWDWQGDQPTQDVVDFMNKNYPPGFTYADFGNQFQAEFFNPDEWADLFNASGAKYVVLTSKHHEGYCLWPSKNSWNWNSKDVGPKRDLVNDLANSIRNRTSIRFGLYHSLFEWFNPLYLSDKAQSFATQEFVKQKTMPELYDIVNKYKPEVVWSDGDWETTDTYWNSTEFIAWLYNDSPVKDTVVTNDRWGSGVLCQHGDIYTCSDNYNPGVLLKHKWENCMPLDSDSWGYRRNMKLSDVRSIEYVIASLTETVSCGGNILINIGPTKEGTIAPVFEERLRQLGSWLKVNGEAIYGTQAWKFQNDTTNPDVWYTSSKSEPVVYAILLQDPIVSAKLTLTSPVTTSSTQISLLGYDGPIAWVASAKTGLVIDLSGVNFEQVKSKWAFVFKMENLM